MTHRAGPIPQTPGGGGLFIARPPPRIPSNPVRVTCIVSGQRATCGYLIRTDTAANSTIKTPVSFHLPPCLCFSVVHPRSRRRRRRPPGEPAAPPFSLRALRALREKFRLYSDNSDMRLSAITHSSLPSPPLSSPCPSSVPPHPPNPRRGWPVYSKAATPRIPSNPVRVTCIVSGQRATCGYLIRTDTAATFTIKTPVSIFLRASVSLWFILAVAARAHEPGSPY